MTSAITMLRMIHDHMTVANMNAWHWWALMDTDNPIADQARQNPALIQAGVTFKRANALGNFAKFVRPGMVRVGATSRPATDILVSAYRDDTGSQSSPSTPHRKRVSKNSGSMARSSAK